MVKFVKNFAIQGGKKAQDMKFVLLVMNTFVFPQSGNLIHGDGSVSKIDSLGSCKDGMLIRIEPMDPTVYSEMMKKEKKLSRRTVQCLVLILLFIVHTNQALHNQFPFL